MDSHFLVPAGIHCVSVSVCSVCSSQSFMWLPGTENLSVSCRRFQLRSVPLSALKNPLFHTHELHYLWPWLKWAVSGHAACVCLCFCGCAMWQMGSNMAHLCPDRCGTAHHTEPERYSKPQEHLDLWQPSPSANKLTLPSC